MRPKNNTRNLKIYGKLLNELEKLWKDSEEPNDFGYFIRAKLKELVNGKEKR